MRYNKHVKYWNKIIIAIFACNFLKFLLIQVIIMQNGSKQARSAQPVLSS